MPRVSLSTDYLLEQSYRTLDSIINHSSTSNRYYQTSIEKVIDEDEQSTILSPNDINEILSRKLYNQLKTVSQLENQQNVDKKSETSVSSIPSAVSNLSTTNLIDSELLVLIDRFYNLTYLNTLPMVNLLATAVASNFLKENIRELDNKLQEQQAAAIVPLPPSSSSTVNIKRGMSLFYASDNDDDDDNVSWASAPN